MASDYLSDGAAAASRERERESSLRLSVFLISFLVGFLSDLLMVSKCILDRGASTHTALHIHARTHEPSRVESNKRVLLLLLVLIIIQDLQSEIPFLSVSLYFHWPPFFSFCRGACKCSNERAAPHIDNKKREKKDVDSRLFI